MCFRPCREDITREYALSQCTAYGIRIGGLAAKRPDLKLADDYEVVLAAVKSYGEAVKFASQVHVALGHDLIPDHLTSPREPMADFKGP